MLDEVPCVIPYILYGPSRNREVMFYKDTISYYVS